MKLGGSVSLPRRKRGRRYHPPGAPFEHADAPLIGLERVLPPSLHDRAMRWDMPLPHTVSSAYPHSNPTMEYGHKILHPQPWITWISGYRFHASFHQPPRGATPCNRPSWPGTSHIYCGLDCNQTALDVTAQWGEHHLTHASSHSSPLQSILSHRHTGLQKTRYEPPLGPIPLSQSCPLFSSSRPLISAPASRRWSRHHHDNAPGCTLGERDQLSVDSYREQLYVVTTRSSVMAMPASRAGCIASSVSERVCNPRN